MYRSSIAIVLGALALPVLAQMTPVGVWRSMDDKTGQPKAEIRISADAGGVLTGVVEKALKPSAEPTCEKCTDDRKGKPKLGMEIIRGAAKTEGKPVWEGGSIVDPDSGTVYKLKMTPIDGGNQLEVRGFVGFALLGRTQTWTRIP
jgi:uncharacterized protein (DUF2147 family)